MDMQRLQVQNNKGNVNYKRKTTVSPYSLQKVITDTFLKSIW